MRETFAESNATALHRPLFPRGRAAESPECDAPCAEAARPYVLAATILGSSMAFIDGAVVNVALPAIQDSFDADFHVLQWIVNAYTLILGALILAGGALGDRYGRRRAYVTGIALFAIASIACALAPTASVLVAARGVQGFGAALLVPQSLAIIAASFPKDVRGRAIGIWAAMAAITTAAGPLVGGLLIDLSSWRAAFWINVPLAIVAVALALRFVPESRGGVRGPLDWSGALCVTGGLAFTIYALTGISDRGPGDPTSVAMLAAGLALLVLFICIEARVRAPLMPLSVFRSSAFSAANAVTLCLYFALSGVLFLLPYMLIQIRGYTELEAGAALLPFGIVMGLFSSRAGALGDRFGPRWPLAIGSALVAVACLVFYLIEGLDTHGFWTAYLPAILILSIGMTIVVAPLTTAVMNSVSDSETGAASGINNAVSRIAGVLGVAVVGLAAIVVFSSALEASLAAARVDADLLSELMGRADKLAALEPPQGIHAGTASQIRTAIADAFSAAYRSGLLIAASAAALAALLSALFLPGGRAGSAQ
jgi:EmrB/QacA subfamily drug resistance transporter